MCVRVCGKDGKTERERKSLSVKVEKKSPSEKLLWILVVDLSRILGPS